MRKVLNIEVDCANCAAKIENSVKKIDGVMNVAINFMAQKMVLEADDGKFDEILEKVIKTGKKVDSDFEVKA